MIIHVTKMDIDHGNVTCCETCPIAIALQRVFRKEARVYSKLYRTETNGVLRRLPEAARTFVRRFDNFEHVEPFTFEIEE